MAVSGTLSVTVHQLKAELAESAEEGDKFSVRLIVGDNERQTPFMALSHEQNQTLQYNMQSRAETEKVTIEVHKLKQGKALVSTTRTLRDFMEGLQNEKMTLSFGSSRIYVFISTEWKPTKQESKVLAPAETHRPWFMRASYYYQTTKNVYDYTTSFRVVKPFARFGETAVNTVLATVTGKTLLDVDQSLVVPVLNSVDNKVDATISAAFTKLYAGQQFVVRTKNKATHGVSTAARKTGNTAVQVTNYTTNKVVGGTGAVYGAVTGVAGFAKSQVVHASSSTYGMVRGMTYAVARHTPILRSKIRA